MKSESREQSAMSRELAPLCYEDETEAEANAKALIVMERRRRISERMAAFERGPAATILRRVER